MSRFEACRRLKSSPVGAFTRIILVSGKRSTAERIEGHDAGADDYVVKPFDHDELLAKVRIQLRLHESRMEVRRANLGLQEFDCSLEQLVDERSRDVVATRDVTSFTLAKLAESCDPETGEHLERMRNYGRILADELNTRGPYRERMDEAPVEEFDKIPPRPIDLFVSTP